MKHSADYPEDLAALARRGRLSSDQLEQLGRALEGSVTLRVADQVGRAFDRVAEVHAGDEQRIAECVDRVMVRRAGPVAPWRSWRLALVAAIALGSATAAGVVGWRYSTRSDAASAGLGAATASAATHGAQPARARAGLPENHDGVTPQPASAASALRSVPHTKPRDPELSPQLGGEPRGLASARTPDRAVTDAETPGELFSRANAARRAGQLERAISLYLELQQAHPRSAEASMSHVSLGRLLLARGQPDRALAQFSRYGGGPLEEEVLLGKAQSLARLGRKSEERAAWKTLLARHPGSLYATEAREHLGDTGEP